MEIRVLKYFLTVAREESISRAAEVLHLSQPTLSRQLAQLEEETTVQPFAMPLSSGLRATGDVKFTMWSSIFCTVVCRTFLSFLLAKWLGMGVIGIALAMALDWCIKAGLDIWRFRSGKWKNRQVI